MDLRDRNIVVTGGTRGIGLATSRNLASRRAAVLVVGRSEVGGRSAVASLRADTRNARVEFLRADLASQTEVRRLAKTITERHGQLHALVNNAAALFPNYTKTEDGVEATYAIAHVAPFLLTELLLPALRAGAPSRIVNVTSGIVRRVSLDGGEPASSQDYDQLAAYGRAKLANLVWTFELARRLSGTDVRVFPVDPGVADTGTHRDYSWSLPVKAAMLALRPVLSRLLSAEKGALSTIRAVSAPELERSSGLLLDRRGREASPPEIVQRDAAAADVERSTERLLRGALPYMGKTSEGHV